MLVVAYSQRWAMRRLDMPGVHGSRSRERRRCIKGRRSWWKAHSLYW
jgi:hypothetical protein